MIRIDRQINAIVRIQIPLSERGEFIRDLERVGAAVAPSELRAEGGTLLISPHSNSLSVEVGNQQIGIKLRDSDLEDLIQAIREHIDEHGELPLDHPLEPMGAKSSPSSIEDVVFETVSKS